MNFNPRTTSFFLEPFSHNNKTNRVLVAIFLLVNSIVLFNAICHDPSFGYDAKRHLYKIKVLSEFRMPKRKDTPQYHVPPLYYVLPALFHAAYSKISGDPDLYPAAKFAQFCNVIYSLGLAFYLLKICQLMRPDNAMLKILSLASLGAMPAYYKSFAFVRAEPLLAFLTVYIVFKVGHVYLRGDYRFNNILLIGGALGCLTLTRRFGFSLFPAIAIVVVLLILKRKEQRLVMLKSLLVCFILAMAIGAWFYTYSYKTSGTALEAFTTAGKSNQPTVLLNKGSVKDFVKSYGGLGLKQLFTDPARPSLKDKFFPMFYSSFWGDYQCYFLLFGRKKGEQREEGDVALRKRKWKKSIRPREKSMRYFTGRRHVLLSGLGLEISLRDKAWQNKITTNRYSIMPYLGRVNLVSLLPSLVFLAGIVLGLICLIRFIRAPVIDDRIAMSSLLSLTIVLSSFGYFCMVVMFYKCCGIAKATYLLYVFPLMAALSGELLCRLKDRNYRVFLALIIILSFVWAHNSGTYITKYILW